jgi:hypothetical protein
MLNTKLLPEKIGKRSIVAILVVRLQLYHRIKSEGKDILLKIYQFRMKNLNQLITRDFLNPDQTSLKFVF